MLEIDGSFGEGGGQVLRTSLTLSLITGQPLEIYNIRARREKPGLQPQHVKCVEAATLISKGQVRGDKVGSRHLFFEPGEVTPGEYQIDIGTAGSTSLVLHTIYLPLALTKRESYLVLTGGTHVPWSPCFHYLSLHWLKYLQRIGFDVKLKLDHAGFYPQGGGKIRAEIFPVQTLKTLTLSDRGSAMTISGLSAVANLDFSIAERQRNQALKRLEPMGYQPKISIEKMPARFKNTLMLLQSEFDNGSGCFTALGAIGKRAEKVADEAVDDLLEYLNSHGCVDKYLTDQLILPLSMVNGESKFSTSKITNHLVTNAEVVKKFLNIEIDIDGKIGSAGVVKIIGSVSRVL